MQEVKQPMKPKNSNMNSECCIYLLTPTPAQNRNKAVPQGNILVPVCLMVVIGSRNFQAMIDDQCSMRHSSYTTELFLSHTTYHEKITQSGSRCRAKFYQIG
jgi:hypothetical protein